MTYRSSRRGKAVILEEALACGIAAVGEPGIMAQLLTLASALRDILMKLAFSQEFVSCSEWCLGRCKGKQRALGRDDACTLPSTRRAVTSHHRTAALGSQTTTLPNLAELAYARIGPCIINIKSVGVVIKISIRKYVQLASRDTMQSCVIQVNGTQNNNASRPPIETWSIIHDDP